ncbi:hypothetical protein K7G98_40930, partial [Saccharothrix sp. MB29]|nr:hypothetical protein [Saccharothrix sp. MB29]
MYTENRAQVATFTLLSYAQSGQSVTAGWHLSATADSVRITAKDDSVRITASDSVRITASDSVR